MKLLITVPKSGTYLFKNMMGAFKIPVATGERADLPAKMFLSDLEIAEKMKSFRLDRDYCFHLSFSEVAVESIKKFDWVGLLLRDPRDLLISAAHHIDSRPSSPLNFSADGFFLTDLPLSKRFDWLIENWRDFLLLFDGWREFGLEIFSYDNFIANPEPTISRLADLGFGTVEKITERSKKRMATYRTGTSGNWKNDFSETQKQNSIKNFGDIIEAWT